MTKTESPVVQAIVNQAIADGAGVFRSGRHIVAVRDGVPFYLGGGVENPAWRPMRQLAVETPELAEAASL